MTDGVYEATDALTEIGRQMAIYNRLLITKELFKLEAFDHYDYMERLEDLEDELVMA